MTPEQLQSLSKAFSVSHLFDIFIQLAPYVLVVASILLGVSIVSSLIKRLRYHLIMKKYDMGEDPYDYIEDDREEYYDPSIGVKYEYGLNDDDDAYVDNLARGLDDYQADDNFYEPEEAQERAEELNREYKRMTGEYYIDPQKIRDHYNALRRG